MIMMFGFLMNDWILGGTAFLLGIHQFGWLKNNIGEMEIISLPLFGAVTPLKLLGLFATLQGAMILYDCCFPQMGYDAMGYGY